MTNTNPMYQSKYNNDQVIESFNFNTMQMSPNFKPRTIKQSTTPPISREQAALWKTFNKDVNCNYQSKVRAKIQAESD